MSGLCPRLHLSILLFVLLLTPPVASAAGTPGVHEQADVAENAPDPEEGEILEETAATAVAQTDEALRPAFDVLNAFWHRYFAIEPHHRPAQDTGERQAGVQHVSDLDLWPSGVGFPSSASHDLARMEPQPVSPAASSDPDAAAAGVLVAAPPGADAAVTSAWLAAPALAGLVLAVLFSRLRPERLRAHAIRAQALTFVEREPGIRPAELARRIGIRSSHLVHHLALLERHGLLIAEVQGRSKFLFLRDTPPADRPRTIALQNPKAGQVAKFVASHPGARLKDVHEGTGLSASLAAWHLKRLVEAEVLQADTEGRTRYFPGA